MHGARFAAKSFASTDSSIVVRALVFASLLSKDNKKACESLIENGAVHYIVEYLNSSNESLRVESLNVLENISLYSSALPLFAKF